MPGIWDISRERRLLLCVIEVTNPKPPPSWPVVAEKMGEGFTAEACRQHFNKIKRETKGNTTPSKPKATKETTGTAKSSGKKRKASEPVDDDATESFQVPKALKFDTEEEHEDIIFKTESYHADEENGVNGEESLYE